MSELMIPTTNLPAEILQQFGCDDNEDMMLTGISIPKLSIKGSKFTLIQPDGGKIALKTFDVNIVILGISPKGKAVSKAYYKGAYDPTQDDRLPDCFSSDGVRPDPAAELKQSTSCEKCPFNVFGYTDDQGNQHGGKKCKDSKTMFFVFSEDVSGEIHQMRVPPSSFKSLTEYAKLLTKYRRPRSAVITTISFVDGVAHPQLDFNYGGDLQPADMMKALERSKSPEVMDLIGSGVEFDASVEPTKEAPKAPEIQEEIVVTERRESVTVDHVPEVTATPEVDANGLPWDERINTSNKAMTKKGVWKRKPGLDDDFYDDIIDELSGAGEAKPEPVKQAAPAKQAPPTTQVESVFDSDPELDELLEGLL